GQGGLHGILETGQRKTAIGAAGVTAAVSAINAFVGIQEKGKPRQIVVEIEDVQIRAANLEQAHADKLVRHLGDPLQTNNLFVEFLAVSSGLAAEDHEEWFAAAPGGRPGGLIVRKPAGLLRRRLRVLATTRAVKSQKGKPKQAPRQPPSHAIFSYL